MVATEINTSKLDKWTLILITTVVTKTYNL